MRLEFVVITSLYDTNASAMFTVFKAAGLKKEKKKSEGRAESQK